MTYLDGIVRVVWRSRPLETLDYASICNAAVNIARTGLFRAGVDY